LLCSSAAAAPNPLSPIAGFTTGLTKGMTAVIKGKDARAFAPLAAVAKRPFGPELKAAGVAAVRLLGVELHLAFFDGDKPAYLVRTGLAPTRTGPAIVALKGESVSKLVSKTHPPRDFVGAGAPVATTALALAKALAGSSCARLPVAPISEFEFIPARFKERATGGLEHARTVLPEICKQVAALKPGKMQLRVDDVSFAALDRSGKMVGLVKAKLELAGDKLTLYYGKFRVFQPEPGSPKP